jgi:ribosomal RNA assembly protein
MEYLRIPLKRIGVFIGKDGKIKRDIEKRLNVKIQVDAEEGTIMVENQGDDVLAEWTCRDVVKAIGGGLSPRKAMKLCSDDYVLERINIEDFVGRSKKAMVRQKARIIGSKGRTRHYIEELSGASIAVLGKNVTIVGTPEEASIARESICMLAEGIPHGVVYRVLQKKAKELKLKKFSLWRGEDLIKE